MADQPRLYSVYGLRIKTELPLPCPVDMHHTPPDIELIECPASVFSTTCTQSRTDSCETDFYQRHCLADGSVHVRWLGLFEFLVSAAGDRIGWRSLNGHSIESLQTYLLGQALSFSLLKKGLEPLHATAVVINGQAVALLGDGGYGKSTLAAALLRLGHRLLTDDLLVLSEQESAVMAQPGTPRLKLFPETAHRLFEPSGGAVMNPLTRKSIFALDPAQCHSQPVPLRAVYLLPSPRSHCSAISISRVAQRRAFLALLKNTFNASIAERARLQQQFSFASWLLAKVPVRSLRYPRNLELVPEVAQAIVADSERDR